jgi:cyclohexadienyl dehydratase
MAYNSCSIPKRTSVFIFSRIAKIQRKGGMRIMSGLLKKRVYLALAAAVVLALTLGSMAGAQTSRLDEILERGVVRVGTTGDYKPFTYLDKETEAYEGIDIDMAKSLAKALGVKLEFVPTTWKEIVTGVVEERYDVAMGGFQKSWAARCRFSSPSPVLKRARLPLR